MGKLPLRLESRIYCLPPRANYSHPQAICLPLYSEGLCLGGGNDGNPCVVVSGVGSEEIGPGDAPVRRSVREDLPLAASDHRLVASHRHVAGAALVLDRGPGGRMFQDLPPNRGLPVGIAGGVGHQGPEVGEGVVGRELGGVRVVGVAVAARAHEVGGQWIVERLGRGGARYTQPGSPATLAPRRVNGWRAVTALAVGWSVVAIAVAIPVARLVSWALEARRSGQTATVAGDLGFHLMSSVRLTVIGPPVTTMWASPSTPVYLVTSAG